MNPKLMILAATMLIAAAFPYLELIPRAIMLVVIPSISWLVGENPGKGLIVPLIGILLATIRMSTLFGSERSTLGNRNLALHQCLADKRIQSKLQDL